MEYGKGKGFGTLGSPCVASGLKKQGCGTRLASGSRSQSVLMVGRETMKADEAMKCIDCEACQMKGRL